MEDYTKYFYVNARETFSLSDEAPIELKRLIDEIHNDFNTTSNFWIYSQILGAFNALEDDDIDNVSIEADRCNNDLFDWLKEPFSLGVIGDYYLECGNENGNIINQIKGAQWFAMDKIYHMVNDFLEDMESFSRR